MLNFIPYAVRRPFYYVMDLIACSDFRREELSRIFDAYEYEQSMQILGFVNYLGMTGQLDVCKNFDLFADVEDLEQAINKWNDYKAQMNTSVPA
jgi:hypothetical protein